MFHTLLSLWIWMYTLCSIPSSIWHQKPGFPFMLAGGNLIQGYKVTGTFTVIVQQGCEEMQLVGTWESTCLGFVWGSVVQRAKPRTWTGGHASTLLLLFLEDWGWKEDSGYETGHGLTICLTAWWHAVMTCWRRRVTKHRSPVTWTGRTVHAIKC